MALKLRQSLWPLFLISGGAVGYEIALTRYFAVAKWSEYGYWVISIVMVGFALSGVCVALDAGLGMVRHGPALLAWLPPLLVLAAAAGYYGTTVNPFNPLQLQNAVTFLPQLGYIALYYAVLLPFFFLTGLYISLVFVLNDDRVSRVYGFDLTGAGAGAAAALALMFVLHPFQLVPALLVPLAAAALWQTGWRVALAALMALGASEALLLLDDQAAYNDFKAIYAPLHTPNARQLAEVRSPRGLYALLDDFTERVDVDVSNDAGMLGVPGPPASYGLYRDGARIAALPKPGALDTAYAPGDAGCAAVSAAARRARADGRGERWVPGGAGADAGGGACGRAGARSGVTRGGVAGLGRVARTGRGPAGAVARRSAFGRGAPGWAV